MSESSHEKVETSETTVEKPALPDPAEAKRVDVPSPVEKTTEMTFEKKAESDS